jgi:hypothetical protein
MLLGQENKMHGEGANREGLNLRNPKDNGSSFTSKMSKMLGKSVSNILRILSRDFLQLFISYLRPVSRK